MIPVAHLGNAALVLVDIGAWAVVHSATGYAVHRSPAQWFAHDTWLTRERSWERRGHWYRRLRIDRWKDRLPEAGALFAGGVSKRSVPGRSGGGLERLALETRRAEWGHWLAASGSLLFVLWNPPAIAAVMVVYGLAVNAPFIAIQRYNRLRVGRVLARRASTGSAAGASARSRSSFGITGNSIP